MLSKFTMSKISEDALAFNDIIWFYENVLGYVFKNTDDISRVIESAYYNANFIFYSDQIKNEGDFVKIFNRRFGTKYKTLDDLNHHEIIDMIKGDKIYAIVW